MNIEYPFLVLFEPEIPHNVGAIIRLCCCFKTKLVIIRPTSFIWEKRFFNRSVMDYFDKCTIEFFNDFDLFKTQHDGRILSTSCNSGQQYNKIEYQKNDAILMGKESVGLPKEITKQTDIKLNIPIHERSLNLALSSAILLANAIGNLKIN